MTTITLKVKDLKDSIKTLVRFKKTIQGNSPIKFSIEDKVLKLSINGFEFKGYVNSDIPINFFSTEDGDRQSISVCVKELAKRIKTLENSSELVISFKEDHMKLTNDGFSFILGEAPNSVELKMEKGDMIFEKELNTVDFMDSLEFLMFATSTEKVRHYLNGIFLEVKDQGETLRMRATNGHVFHQGSVRLGVEGFKGLKEEDEKLGIVSRFVIKGLIDSIKGKKGSLVVKVFEDAIDFIYGNTVFSSEYVGGVFPDCDKIISKNNKEVFLGESCVMLGALKRLGFTGFALTYHKEEVIIVDGRKKYKDNLDEFRLVLKVSKTDSNRDLLKSVLVGFNTQYMINAFTKRGKFSFKYFDELSPCRIDFEDSKMAVIMPMILT